MNVMVGKVQRRDPKIRVPNEILGRIGGSEMTVFLLMSWLDRKGRGAQTSVVRLSGCTGLSAPTVHAALRRLEEKELIAYFPGRVPSDPWTYRVLLRPGRDRYFTLPLSFLSAYSGNELLVAGQLSCCVNAFGVAYPSYRRIAAALDLAVNTVRACLTRLKETMALEMIPRLYKLTRARRSFAYSLLFGGVSKIYMLVHKPTKERKDCENKKEVEKNLLTLKGLNLCAQACRMAGRVLQKLADPFRRLREPARRQGREPCEGRDARRRRKNPFSFLFSAKGGHSWIV